MNVRALEGGLPVAGRKMASHGKGEPDREDRGQDGQCTHGKVSVMFLWQQD